METLKTTIKAVNGMHARPASELVKLAKGLDSKIMLSNGVKQISATSMLGILSLGLKCGTEVTVSAEGGNEAENAQAVASFLSSVND